MKQERQLDPADFDFYDADAKRNAKSISLLIAAGADVNARVAGGHDAEGKVIGVTFLHLAAAQGRNVSRLIAAGADVHAVVACGHDAAGNEIGGTPLIAAANNGMNLSQLIAAGADVNVRDHHHRQTPLHIATLWNDLRSVRQLIAAGADVDARDAKGETPIQLAQRELANCADAAEETDAFQAIIDEIEHHCRSRDLAHLHATVPQAAGDPAQTPNPPKPRHGLRL